MWRSLLLLLLPLGPTLRAHCRALILQRLELRLLIGRQHGVDLLVHARTQHGHVGLDGRHLGGRRANLLLVHRHLLDRGLLGLMGRACSLPERFEFVPMRRHRGTNLGALVIAQPELAKIRHPGHMTASSVPEAARATLRQRRRATDERDNSCRGKG
ncbi:MAG TPA: hypothetical protein VFG86_06175 [Chloroflexota bacterium]|nr:hypothetical protein [Chloroflexota bacterium]